MDILIKFYFFYSRSKSKHGRRSKNNQTPTKTVNYKSAPSSPVGTPRKLVTNMTANSQHTVINSQLRNNKKELDLNPQWITAFPTVETPSESGFPITSGKLTGIFWLRLDFLSVFFKPCDRKINLNKINKQGFEV